MHRCMHPSAVPPLPPHDAPTQMGRVYGCSRVLQYCLGSMVDGQCCLPSGLVLVFWCRLLHMFLWH